LRALIRVNDLVFFTAKHDDHPLAQIIVLKRLLAA